jgi:hypothetical protein
MVRVLARYGCDGRLKLIQPCAWFFILIRIRNVRNIMFKEFRPSDSELFASGLLYRNEAWPGIFFLIGLSYDFEK